MFQEGRTNVDNNECKGRPSMIFDTTVQCVDALLKDDHCLTITDMRQELVAHFSHKAGDATIVCTL